MILLIWFCANLKPRNILLRGAYCIHRLEVGLIPQPNTSRKLVQQQELVYLIMRVLKHYWKGNQAHVLGPRTLLAMNWLFNFLKTKDVILNSSGGERLARSNQFSYTTLSKVGLYEYIRFRRLTFSWSTIKVLIVFCIISYHEPPSIPTLDSMNCHESHWCLTEVHHHAGMPVADVWEPCHRDDETHRHKKGWKTETEASFAMFHVIYTYMFIASIICPSSDQSCRGSDSQDRGVCWDVISVSGKGFPIRFSLAAAAFIKHVKHDPPCGCLWSDRFQHGFLNGWVGSSQNMLDVVW